MKLQKECQAGLLAILAIGVSLITTGCGGGNGGGGQEGGTTKVQVSAEDRAEARSLFTTRCAACHGNDGTGNGPGAAGLNPKPRNYRDRNWQRTVTDEEIERAIVYGGAAVGKSPQMTANPDLQAKPGVVAALREMIREFGRG